MDNLIANTSGDLAAAIEKVVAGHLAGKDDFEKLKAFSEMIETFSQDVPAALADMRVDWVRRLAQTYTLEEIQANSGLSPSRVRKLLER